VLRLAKTVTEWVQDPDWSERSFGWVTEPPTGYVRPVQQVLAVLGHPSSQAADPVAVLVAYVTFYDQRGGDIETSVKSDKRGLGLTKRPKKRSEAQQMLVLLGSLAHNVVVWARRWLSSPQIQHCGILRIARDVFHVIGLLRFDASGSVVEIVLHQGVAWLAHSSVLCRPC